MTERKISRERLARQRVRCNSVIDSFRAMLDAETAARKHLDDLRRTTAANFYAVGLSGAAHDVATLPAADLQHLVPTLPANIASMNRYEAVEQRAAQRNVIAIIENLEAAERVLQLTSEAKDAAKPRYRALLAYSERLEKLAKEYGL